ncbi:hypothetical protein N7532_009171 [Penicillium argentinense]|uniref:NACHT domain-containing protein n=1 Tax=Penicillium argentinense TaxID=1131581 RepID=A0A9W9EYV9_9EURO|nr:uncharacterized protein N7532_009171 [Penicillium argentinense]KAJ5090487.1 hypothetical protein N7532_009171 [Penicillium argentinense]
MSTPNSSSAFEKALETFKGSLSKRDQNTFKAATFQDLQSSIDDLQRTQHGKRQTRWLKRLGPFLEAMDQWGKVVEVFCNSNEIVAFVWGPVKFLLQVASNHQKAFTELLDTYEAIGEHLPLLLQYQDLFRVQPEMVRVLSLIYEDILEFHRLAIQYFQQRSWKQLFDDNWKAKKARFATIISSLGRHRGLVETQANILHMQAFDDLRRQINDHHDEQMQGLDDARQLAESGRGRSIQEFEQARQIADSNHRAQLQLEEKRQMKKVFDWLRAPNTDFEHYKLKKTREIYPNTGRWLLEHPSFKEWLDPDYAKIPPLLWLNGIPGSGKTVLASIVVEEARKLSRKSTVLFFYCKHDDPEFNSFIAIARGLLAQILEQELDLLPHFYEQCCISKEPILQNPERVQKLLETALAHCKSAYIVLDGLDECKRDDRKEISSWFRERVDKLPASEPWRLRCLFTSRDDGHGRKDFEDIDTIKIRASDIADDLMTFCQRQADQLKINFHLTNDQTDSICETVAQRAGGMFLLPKLVWNNLSQQTSLVGMERELDPSVYPKQLEDAYRRILSQMETADSSRGNKIPRDVKLVLQWLTLARRPLAWREIQVLKSIDRQKQEVDFERHKFRVENAKDLCGSFVNVLDDGTVELVHLTAKHFLVDEGIVDPLVGDIKMASLCVDYLNLPIFVGSISDQAALRGDYGFMEYAALYWIRHLEGAIAEARRRLARAKLQEDQQPEDSEDEVEAFVHPTLQEKEYSRLMSPLAESLGVFIEHHWASPKSFLAVSDRNKRNLKVFENTASYEKLQQVFVSSRKQLHSFGPIKTEELATDISEIVNDVREVIKNAFSASPSPSATKEMTDKYGHNPFRCARFSCRSFTFGFATPEEREGHMARHERPYRCNHETCKQGFDIGFSSIPQYKRHMKTHHPDPSQADHEFPTDKEIQLSIRSKRNESKSAKELAPAVNRDEASPQDTEEASPEREGFAAPAPEPEIRPRPRMRWQNKKDLICQDFRSFLVIIAEGRLFDEAT